MATEQNERIEQIAPGLYVVKRADQEEWDAYTLTDEQLDELLAPIQSRVVADHIRERYRAATRASGRRWFDFLLPRRRRPSDRAA